MQYRIGYSQGWYHFSIFEKVVKELYCNIFYLSKKFILSEGMKMKQ